MSHAIVLLSGGVDSAVALYWARRQGQTVTALSLNYHQRPESERRASAWLATDVGAALIEVPVPYVKEAVDLRADGLPVPAADGAPEGFVPMRNLLFYSIAAYYAEAVGADVVIGGHLAHDAESFPDASPSFFEALQSLVNQGRPGGDGRRLRFLLPFADKTKVEVIRLARELHVPLEHTWSCYENAEQPCGRCVSCVERAAAIRAAGIDFS